MALQLRTSSNYTVSESFVADTRDYNNDHSFCGIMFDVEVKNNVPIEYLCISHLWVKGMLGNLTVWWREVLELETESTRLFHREEEWSKIYENFKEPSEFELCELELDTTISLQPGKRYSLYVHSSRNDDQAIKYAKHRNHLTYEDPFLTIFPGTAHISQIPFDNHGWWGWAWRPRREFVGRISYGVRYLCWKPERPIHFLYPRSFRKGVMTLFLCSGRAEFPLPRETVLYIINMCRWDWFGHVEEEKQQRRPRLISFPKNHILSPENRDFYSFEPILRKILTFKYSLTFLVVIFAFLLRNKLA